jgi:hypothetical protein
MGSVSSVGIVKSAGEFRVDGSTIRGNGTVFEGNLIQTTAARSTVQLGEAQITLLPNSSAKVYRDHTVLESGSELMRNGEKRTIEAATLQIASPARDGVVLVAIGGPNNVKVFASSGAAQVRTASGFLLASLNPGMGLAFTPQAGAAPPMQMTGVVESTNGKFFLTDTSSPNKTRVELRGTDLAKFKGKSVQVTGSVILGAAAAGGASQVVQVTKIEQLSAKAKAAGAAGAAGGAAAGGAGAAAGGAAAGGAVAAGGAAAGAGAAAAGIGAATIAVGGAAAAAATVGGLIASGAISAP